MAIQTIQYLEVSWAFLSEAADALAREDLGAASRQGWCAAAWALRGFAQAKGWRYTGFYGINGVMNNLVEEYSGTWGLDYCFSSAAALEMNSYDPWECRASVEDDLGQVAELLRKLERLAV